MAVPKRRKPRSKIKMRQRSDAHRRPLPGLSIDKQGGGEHLSHRVCPDTGMYRGRQVLPVKTED